MEHRQYFKMVFWEGSTHVPLIISAGKNFNIPRGVISNHLTSSLDFFPTICQMANVSIPNSIQQNLDGYSLMPFLDPSNWQLEKEGGIKKEVFIGDEFEDVRPNYVMSQFHGGEIHLPWFMLRKVELFFVRSCPRARAFSESSA